MRAAPHRRAAALRWAAVLVGTTLLVSVVLVGRPASGGPAGAGDAAAAEQLLARAAASADVAFTGTATSRGALGLPDLPRLGRVAALAGESTRTRTWWQDESTWRTDVLTATGEQGLYASGGTLTGWDYEDDAVTVGAPLAGARLPRAGDLLPPALARSLLAGSIAGGGAAADAVVLGARVIAGRTADGVRLSPAAADRSRTTLDHADVWVDRTSGLPLAVEVVDVVGGPVLLSAFDAVQVGAPDPAALRAPDPPGAVERTAEEDLAASAASGAPWRLPDALAGLPALQDPATTGVVAYGDGLLRIAAVPLPPRQGFQALRAAEASGAVPLDPPLDPTGGAEAALVRAGALTAAIVVDGSRSGGRGDDDGPRAWLLSGAVEPAVLAQAAAELVAAPAQARA